MTAGITTDLILGTAGHIDHGKTSLVKALTGVDTDRLPEEKKRGITIELGFAELDLGEYRLGIVDVPGHERFVRNMLAGATGIDLALLVVAADDSIKPQTREHLEILRLLGIEHGVIGLTKCDLVERDWLDLVEEDVRQLVRGTFLAESPMVRLSAHTGQGIAELKSILAAQAAKAAGSDRCRKHKGPFRMAIDRSFTVAGHGTVVTGSVQGGAARLGDELVIEPGGMAVRVRGLQNHDRSVEEVRRGQRAAINLAGVHHEQIGRGLELASPGHLTPSRLLSVRLHLLPSTPAPLRQRTRVHLHVGTAELMASASLVDRERVEPGEWANVQLFLSKPVVTTWGQAFVVRSESPVFTIGGGQVIDPHASKIRRRDSAAAARLSDLASADSLTRASAALYFAGLGDFHPIDLARSAAIDDYEAASAALAASGDLVRITLSPTRRLSVHRLVLEELSLQIEASLARLHKENPLKPAIDRRQLLDRFRYLQADVVLDHVLESMHRASRLRLSPQSVTLAGHGPQLTANEQKLMESLLERFRQAGFQPPTVAEVQAEVKKNSAAVPQLVSLAVSDGTLVKVSPDYHLHAEVENKLRTLLQERLANGKGLTVSEIRELLGNTRKHAVPLCEYLDRIGFTRREGDVRMLAG
jgi:selenocysteine-specific elongation factor